MGAAAPSAERAASTADAGERRARRPERRTRWRSSTTTTRNSTRRGRRRGGHGATVPSARRRGHHARTCPHGGARNIQRPARCPDDRPGRSSTERTGMATTPAAGERTPRAAQALRQGGPGQGRGSVLFAGIMMMILGVLNVVWGIAAIDSSSFFVEDQRFILSDLQHLGLDPAGSSAQCSSPPRSGSGRAARSGAGSASPSRRSTRSPRGCPSPPIRSWCASQIFAVDVLVVIYGLATYGGDRRVVAG